jgi:ABC-type antimicrobial peptide transport system permease subunit
MVAWRYVTPGYFAALGIPILQGRAFQEEDRGLAVNSIVLSRSLARKLFPGGNPLGRRVLRGPQGQWFTVIGVAGDVRNRGLEREGDPEYYVVRKAVPDFTYENQEPSAGWRSAAIVARTAIDPRFASEALRGAVASLDPTLPVEVETMRQRVDEITVRPRFNAALFSAFAATGAVLASIGLFGVLSFLVARRTREIGVRMALGATPGRILALVLGHASRWVAAGVLTGGIASLALTRLLRSLLYQVDPWDPGAIAAAAGVLLVAAALASIAPARAASRLDPMENLRQE